MAGINFLYYCSLQDVKDWLFDVAFVETDQLTVFDDRRLRRAIGRAYGEINGALKSGGYDVPVSNSVKTVTQGAETASTTDPVVIAVASGDGINFSSGDTTRIHGVSTTPYKDEFVGVVLVATDNVTVEYLENDYDSGATVELCSEGYLYLRECNAKGAAAKLLFGKIVGQAKSRNEKITTLLDEYNACLKLIRDGDVDLDGLTAGASVVDTYFTDNPSATDVSDRVVTANMEF